MMKRVTNVFSFFIICFLTESLDFFSRINTIRQNILSCECFFFDSYF